MKLYPFKAFPVLLAVLMLTGCRKNDAPEPDNTLNFEAAETGIEPSSGDATVKIQLARPATVDIPVAVQLATENVTYDVEFVTEPAPAADVINLTIPRGASSTEFKIQKKEGAVFYGDEKITFSIKSAGTPAVVGSTAQIRINFAEFVAEEASIVLDGGGPTYGNKVFFDLSASRQTAVERTKWDLGFKTGDGFNVILNSSTGMMAKALDKTNLAEVSAADTAGFSEQMSFAAFSPDALSYIDYPDGDLSKTAIAAVSANDDENKVYIINRGTGIGSPAPPRGWKKVKVLRSADGYVVQYADIDATAFEQIDVTKSTDHDFDYVSFDEGTVVEVEPEKGRWDFAWTYFSNVTTFGADEIPYTFQDFIIQSPETETAVVMTEDVSYESFAEANLEGLQYNQYQNAIGSDWRSGGGPNSAPSIKTDRFYVIHDAGGNYYKVRFTALTKDGERGHPAFDYALVKKG